MTTTRYILTLSCADTIGIVAAVTQFLVARQGFVLESSQFGEPLNQQFFMRVVFELPINATISPAFEEQIATPFKMQWQLRKHRQNTRVLVMVSKQGHCLNDILHRANAGHLAASIVGIVSNHQNLEHMASWYQVPFYYLPVNKDNKAQQEQALWAIFCELQADVLVLARYMQILSPEIVNRLKSRAINIHHSFLPGFMGAKAYEQAYQRGVKIIGATAHYVTDTLDEGPIIEQEVIRVTHAHSPHALSLLGQDIESLVLARALKYHLEQRVILCGNKTIVFQ